MPAWLAPAIGGLLGGIGGLFGGGPRVQQYGGQFSAGLNPLTGESDEYLRQLMQQGNLGFGFLSGDPAAVSRLQAGYLSASNPAYQQSLEGAQNLISQRAAQAGAFGGSRQGVATGAALGNLAAQNQLNAYQAAMQQAGQLAGYGAQAGQGLAASGQYQQGLAQSDLDRRYMEFVRQQQARQGRGGGLGGAITGALGGAATAAGLFPGRSSAPALQGYGNPFAGAGYFGNFGFGGYGQAPRLY